ncbi:putative Sterigmatocystin 8-O-methyltransferase [Glarea lozoyensis 74030]|uniref:Putative Sterigmatocystin 8-O-methyltransferase n=1 Tax=Glarea lozoyensis (strain ATCC 74030 / MF5533) TaxID=1104152 RepID=H0EWE4_GLAL7|nr:putative Sterigmatocystin 8-O-methyltransferase [Glarea lozoyensis 74030]
MSSTTENASILALAEGILSNTKSLIEQLNASNTALPTFSATSQALPTTPDFQALQIRLKAQLEDLQLLVSGPASFYRHFLVRGYEIATFQLALDFEFFTIVPSKGSISVEDLAEQAGLDVDRTGRLMRMLITQRFFTEPNPGFFSHNSFSIALQKDEEIRSMVHFSFDEILKACAESGAAIKADPYNSDGLHCPFYKRFGVPIFDYYEKNPQYAGRFAKAMAGWVKTNGYSWADLRGTVVDMGGGSGHVSVELAQAFPHLSFAVQDGDGTMLALGPKLLTPDLKDRISFTQASFFEPQKHLGAAAYLIRQCTHNWADADVVRIFKSMVPALEGSAPGTTIERIWERERRHVDMVMLVCYGSKERTVKEFDKLLKEADESLSEPWDKRY